MKKMKVQVLFTVVLLGNAAFMQGMTRSTQVYRQLKRPVGVRLRSGYDRNMYPTPATPQEQEQMSKMEVGVHVNPLREKRLQEQRKKEQGEEPWVELITKEELDKLDEDSQEQYIESLRNELKNNRWQWEGILDPNAPRSELMQVQYVDDKLKRELIEYFDRKRFSELPEQQNMELEEVGRPAELLAIKADEMRAKWAARHASWDRVYPSPASPQEQEEVSKLKVGVFVNPRWEQKRQEMEQKRLASEGEESENPQEESWVSRFVKYIFGNKKSQEESERDKQNRE